VLSRNEQRLEAAEMRFSKTHSRGKCEKDIMITVKINIVGD